MEISMIFVAYLVNFLNVLAVIYLNYPFFSITVGIYYTI